MDYKTEQERFWVGDFGDKYLKRNQGDDILAANLAFFTKALNSVDSLKSCIEFGANIGMNLKALKLLHPELDMSAIEINTQAVKKLESIIPKKNIIHDSILNVELTRQYDLTLIRGVLIHINPEELPNVYTKLVQSVKGYLLVAEYYNPTPVEVNYRGNSDRMFKRDFAGELMDIYPELSLVDYGFSYKRDSKFDHGDVTWFLLKKNA
jgi:pseudaminic acid biosynthesis-associated methylase